MLNFFLFKQQQNIYKKMHNKNRHENICETKQRIIRKKNK
jgi:hypothetical protein